MDQTPYVDTLLLIALPASGKSEVRRFLMHMDKERRIRDFHLSDTVQLDDYPYVEYMREVDDALAEAGEPGAFFLGAEGPFREKFDWGTLLQLVNEDWGVMTDPSAATPAPNPQDLFDRLDAARTKVGAPVVFAPMDASLRSRLADRLAAKTKWVYDELFGDRPPSVEGRTLVIEFARGGPEGHAMPLAPPHGYAWNLAQLRPEILERAAVLYIWVTPEESRRKNAARNIPDAENTVLFHAAPEVVMRGDYGCDDIEWLVDHANRPHTIPITAHGKTYDLPIGRFDNRVDKTTFVREEPETWDPADAERLQQAVTTALTDLWTGFEARFGA